MFEMNIEILNNVYLGNSLRAWLVSCCITLGTYAVLWAVKAAGVRELGKRADRTETTFDDFFLVNYGVYGVDNRDYRIKMSAGSASRE